MSTASATTYPPNGTTIDTLQSLIVAFVVAMTFRGFVTEGFVIPTGSMAPTLMGRHYRMHSDQTGFTYSVDHRMTRSARAQAIQDPTLGPKLTVDFGTKVDGALRMATGSVKPERMGDRILVLKCLYPFSEPDRFDVVVFKNPKMRWNPISG